MVQSGRTVSLVAKYRPPMPILVSPSCWGLGAWGGEWGVGTRSGTLPASLHTRACGPPA